jgi:deoxyribodipyrimidine photo-lyase
MERVDSNGLMPLQASEKVFLTAYSFRRFLQKTLPGELQKPPDANPLEALSGIAAPVLPTDVTRSFSLNDSIKDDSDSIGRLAINHNVPATRFKGGSAAAAAALKHFLSENLTKYADFRNHPDKEVTSRLSPYLHVGHISTHQVLFELMSQEGWSMGQLSSATDGSRKGWWGVSPNAEAFLDELVTWRELGFNMASKQADYHLYRSLPDWAKETLAEHADDPRPNLYEMPDFESAETHDPLWNAAERQLVGEGYIHNYLRMLWGKKILEWSRSAQDALQVMVELNNKYALDGNDPNSYTGIFWVLGRYDRPWGPERPIFGKIRYMSSKNTARKFPVREYLAHYAS